MFLVNDVWEEATKIAGFCDEPKILRWLSDAVTLTANKGDFEGWKGWLDICTSDGGQYLTLPREVEVVYAVNLAGRPALGLGQLFNFHLNGPGDCNQAPPFSWQDVGGNHPTYRNITVPSKLVAYVSSAADNGKELIVHGFDTDGNPLRHEIAGEQRSGYQVPTIFGYAVPDFNAPVIARITAVVKEDFLGPVRLSTIDDSGLTGDLLGIYEPDEKYPQYRRIKISRPCSWVRIAFRRSNPIFTSRYDHVMLKSRIGFLLAMSAIKAYAEKDLGLAHGFEADAARLELEAQNASEPPTYSPVQVLGGSNDLVDKTDYDIR